MILFRQNSLGVGGNGAFEESDSSSSSILTKVALDDSMVWRLWLCMLSTVTISTVSKS